MDARIEILSERLLPHRPYEMFTCPAHVYDSCHATQLLARQPDCSMDVVRRLELCRRRLRVRDELVCVRVDIMIHVVGHFSLAI